MSHMVWYQTDWCLTACELHIKTKAHVNILYIYHKGRKHLIFAICCYSLTLWNSFLYKGTHLLTLKQILAPSWHQNKLLSSLSFSFFALSIGWVPFLFTSFSLFVDILYELWQIVRSFSVFLLLEKTFSGLETDWWHLSSVLRSQGHHDA